MAPAWRAAPLPKAHCAAAAGEEGSATGRGSESVLV